jgi:glycosyltransferase involved in cell wall biosynthesis
MLRHRTRRLFVSFMVPDHYDAIIVNAGINDHCVPPNATADVTMLRAMYETMQPRLSEENLEYVHRFDAILAPTPFHAEGFRAATHVNTMVLPESVDAASFNSTDGGRNDYFTFLFVSTIQPRKGFLELLEAFGAEFGRRTRNVALRIITHNEATSAMLALRRAKRKLLLRSGGLQIDVVTYFVSHADLVREIARAHVLVAPSHGEGWGRTVSEAMAAGRCVIAPNCTGLSSMVTAETALVLPWQPQLVGDIMNERYAKVDIGADYFGADQHMCGYSIDDLRALMRHAYELGADGADAIGERARRFVESNFSRDAIADTLIDVVAEARAAKKNA